MKIAFLFIDFSLFHHHCHLPEAFSAYALESLFVVHSLVNVVNKDLVVHPANSFCANLRGFLVTKRESDVFANF